MLKTVTNYSEVRKALRLIYEDKDPEGLQSFLLDTFGVRLPDEVIIEGNDTPLDAVAAALFDRFYIMLWLANRSGGKTMAYSILYTLYPFLHDDCEIAGAGAIEKQAKRGYGYFTRWLERIPAIARTVVKSTLEKTQFRNKSFMQILVGTLAGMNSPHPQKTLLDEVELMDWAVLQEAFSMPQGKDDIPATLVMASTRKFASGTMERLIDEALERGIKVFKWSILEVIEPWPYDDPALEKRIIDRFERLPADIREALPEDVIERLKAKKSGYYKWEDFLAKTALIDDEVLAAQWFSLKPARTGLIYSKFENIQHPRGNIRTVTESEVRKAADEGNLYLFNDFGFGEGHPNVVLFAIVDLDRQIVHVIDELYCVGQIQQEIMPQVIDKLENDWGLDVDYDLLTTEGENRKRWDFSVSVNGWIPDPAGQTEIAELKFMGAPILGKLDNRELYLVKNGIKFIQTLLGLRKLIVDPRCSKLIKELITYKKKKSADGTFTDTPEKKNDHGPDALRYGLIRLFPNLVLMAAGLLFDHDDDDGMPRPITHDLYSKEF